MEQRQTGIPENILELQNRVVNLALIAFLSMGLIVQAISFFRALEFGFGNIYIFQTGLVILLLVVTISRKRLSIQLKISLMAFLLFAVLISGLYAYGFLASGKIYIAVLPVFASFIISYRKSLLTLFSLVIVYGIFGYLFVNGILQYSFDTLSFVSNKAVWIMESGVILLMSWGLLYVGYYFRKTLIENYYRIGEQNFELENHRKNLEKLVEERTKDLAISNKELKSTNEILYEQSEIINTKNAELKATLDNLEETQSQLIEADKMASLGVLTAGIAHEINNPLNFIKGGQMGLENYFKKHNNKEEDVRKLLDVLKTGADRAAKIVKGLNQFSRSNDNIREECDIHSIINNCLVMLHNQTKHRIEVTKHFSNKTIQVRGNMGKLHQVFINILSNSIQAIEKEGVISIKTELKKNSIFIEISDSGCGICKENLSKIKVPFFTTKDPGAGTGLGLSITSSIIEEHKGNLKFKSILNKGTTAIITLPVALVPHTAS